MAKKRHSPKEIEELYDQIPRLTQERSDFLLPQLVDFVEEKRWINIRPEYQRRLVWDKKKKSRFIESLLMNIPIPPVFLFEHQLSRYEVMDGQQRINTILEFYRNELKLSGLETWTALNGLTRVGCPEKIQRGLDRRRISATVLLTESSGESAEDADRLRQQVFERLNTGGQTLNAQELRNSTFEGPFNDLIVELAGNPLFNDSWGIPRYSEHYDMANNRISAELAANKLFQRMGDCEIVLRFFAFRDVKSIRGSVRQMLDRCMHDNRDASHAEIEVLRSAFVDALVTAHDIFGSRVYQLKNESGKWTHSKTLFDAVMVSLDRLNGSRESLVEHRKQIVGSLHKAINENATTYSLIVGRANTAATIKERLKLVQNVLEAYR